MRIQSRDLPQADRIESVVLATVAVANGAHTDIEIANQVPGIEGDARQGRYYRSAAQMLGFITNAQNNAQITPRGELIANNPVLTNLTLISSVLNLNISQKLLPYLELNPVGVTRQELITYLQSIASDGASDAVIVRRISTIMSWVRTLGIVEYIGDRYRIANAIIPQIPIIDLADSDQPVLPQTGTLQEYQEVEERIASAQETITVYRNQARVERANNAHRHLVNLVAQRIRNAGGIPKSNQFIDLAASLEGDYIFEMKSTTPQNVNAQIRKGVSQLYEYRYLENRPDATLVLVLENSLQNNEEWLLNYLEEDRNIHLLWDGDDNLYGSERSLNDLQFLELLPSQ